MRPYGCFDRSAFRDIRVQDGWNEDGSRRMVWVPFRMKQECDYTHTELGQADARCVGCRHRSEAAHSAGEPEKA